MKNINIKPLSINAAFQGKRFKTPEYKKWCSDVDLLLPKGKVPKGKLKLSLEFGFSNKNADIDNPTKLITDALQFKYGFNDNMIYELNIIKTIVSKGNEFIKFKLEGL